MCRVEIFANCSVQDDLVDLLEKNVDDFYYSIIPVIHGRGKHNRKLGTAVWPEENFTLISYVDEDKVTIIKYQVDKLKERFTTEGIKIFVMSDNA